MTTVIDFLTNSALGRALTAQNTCLQTLWLIDECCDRIKSGQADADELRAISQKMRLLAESLAAINLQLQGAA